MSHSLALGLSLAANRWCAPSLSAEVSVRQVESPSSLGTAQPPIGVGDQRPAASRALLHCSLLAGLGLELGALRDHGMGVSRSGPLLVLCFAPHMCVGESIPQARAWAFATTATPCFQGRSGWGPQWCCCAHLSRSLRASLSLSPERDIIKPHSIEFLSTRNELPSSSTERNPWWTDVGDQGGADDLP